MGLVLLMVPITALAGCLGGEETPPPGEDPEAGPDAATPPEDPGAGRPVLTPGLAFTFSSDGVYDLLAEWTVVVVPRGDGYLLAGASEDDLVGEIVWDNGFFGAVDADLNRPERRDVWRWFDFPLVDGKTWQNGERTVVVRAADVRTPSGTEPGFVMRITLETGSIEWEYAPSIGFITSFFVDSRGAVWERFRLERVHSSSSWVWYEAGDRIERAQDTERAAAGVFEVPAGFDALALSVGGTPGGRVVVGRPDPRAPTYTWEHPGTEGEDWVGVLLPATPGRWSYATLDPVSAEPRGYAWIAAHPVRWLRGDV